MKYQIIILAIIAVVGIGGYTLYQKSSQSGSMEQKSEVMMKKDSGVMDDEKMTDEDKNGKVGFYVPYSPEKIAMAETGDVVLFFHASWCPTCSALNKDIEKNMKSIPEKVTILKTDYDKEMDLKKKYGVTYQHTLVQVDAKGNMIKKWSGGSTLETVVVQIQ